MEEIEHLPEQHIPQRYDRQWPAPTAVLELTVPAKTESSLRELARRVNLAHSVVYATNFLEAVHYWADQDDIVVWVTFGSVAEPVPLRSRYNAEVTRDEALITVGHAMERLRRHRNDEPSDIGSATIDNLGQFGFSHARENYQRPSALAGKCALELHVAARTGGTRLTWRGSGSHVDQHDLRIISAGFLQLAERALDESGAAAAFIDPTSQARILRTGTGPIAPVPAETVSARFAVTAQADPGRVAVLSRSGAISYGELAGRAAVIEHSLTGHGVGAGDRVLVYGARGPDLIAAVLALWGIGASYVPVDTSNPAARIREMSAQVTPAALIAAADPAGLSLPLIPIAGPPDPQPQPKFTAEPVSAEQAAYVLFTSGSTGRPKAVEVGHGAMNNHLGMMTDLGIGHDDRVAQNAPIGFDVHVWQCAGPLSWGGSVRVFDDDECLEPLTFARALRSDGVTVLEAVPPFLDVLASLIETGGLQADCLYGLRHLLPTGQSLMMSLARRLRRIAPNAALINAYGPAEAADDVTFCSVAGDEAGVSAALGQANRNVRIYVLDRHRRLRPDGYVGEIALGGACVGNGYVGYDHRPAFVTDPWHAGERMYLTGDLGALSADGMLYFHGRRDDQVKIGGRRIELAEVESALSKIAGITAAAAVDVEFAGQTCLVAFVVGPDRVDESWIKDWLGRLLPGYALPVRVLALAELPATRNGKLDRQALRRVAASQLSAMPNRDEPEPEVLLAATSTQTAICQAAETRAGSYLQQVVLRVTGRVEFGRLTRAWREMMAAQPALRMVMRPDKARWKAAVLPSQDTLSQHDLRALPESQRQAVVRELLSRARSSIDLRRGPTVSLAILMLDSQSSLWALSYHHAVLDGPSVRIVCSEIASRYARDNESDMRAVSASSAFADIVDLLRSMPDDRPRAAYEAEASNYPHVMPTWPGHVADSAAALTTGHHIVPASEAITAARAAKISVASLVQAALLAALAHASGSQAAALALTVDMRLLEPDAVDLAGMFTCVLPVAATFSGTDSAITVARRLHESRIPLRARPGLGLPELLSLLADRTAGAPDVLLTFQPSDGLPPAPPGLAWEWHEAREATEFALNIDVIATGEQIQFVIQRDTARVSDVDLARLVEDLTAFLSEPARPLRAFQGSGWLAGRQARIGVLPEPPQLLPVVLDALRAATGYAVAADDDLLSAGLSSLTLMLAAVELAERGVPYAVAELLKHRTPRQLVLKGSLEHKRQPDELPPRDKIRDVGDFTQLERGVLARTDASQWGDQPMREQSNLRYLARLDLDTLRAALSDVLEAYPSLRRRYAAAADDTGPLLVDLGDTPDPAGAAMGWLSERLLTPHTPDGAALFAAAAATGDEHTSIALDFHAALLDGWSFGTVIRDWHRAYDARKLGQQFRPSGLDAAEYARWAAGWAAAPDGGAASDYWAGALARAAFPLASPSRQERRRVTLSHALPPTARFAADAGVTPQACAIGLAAAAFAVATGQGQGECTGVRTSVRPVHVAGQLRVIGQVMAEVPVPLLRAAPAPSAVFARSFADFLIRGRDYAHGGDILMKQAAEVEADRDLWRNLVVFEEYLLTDEWMARNEPAPHWREAGTWRREVSPSVRTLYILPEEDGFGLSLSSVADEDPDEVLAEVVVQATRIWSDPTAPLPLAVGL